MSDESDVDDAAIAVGEFLGRLHRRLGDRTYLMLLRSLEWVIKGEIYETEGSWQIPEGFEVVDINGQRSKFQRGVTSGDRRFGALAYGVLLPFKGSQ